MSKLSMNQMQKMLSAEDFHGKSWANIADETAPYKNTYSPPKRSINSLESELEKRKAIQAAAEKKAKKTKEGVKLMLRDMYNTGMKEIKKLKNERQLTRNLAEREKEKVKEKAKRAALSAQNMTRKLRQNSATARKATQNAQNALNRAKKEAHKKKVENIKAAAAMGNKAAREAKEAARKEAHKKKVAATRAAASTRRKMR